MHFKVIRISGNWTVHLTQHSERQADRYVSRETKAHLKMDSGDSMT